jgi:hypothetical protein
MANDETVVELEAEISFEGLTRKGFINVSYRKETDPAPAGSEV